MAALLGAPQVICVPPFGFGLQTSSNQVARSTADDKLIQKCLTFYAKQAVSRNYFFQPRNVR